MGSKLLPDFVIDFLVFEYFQGSNLIEYFRFVEADQVMDYYIWGPNMLKQKRTYLFEVELCSNFDHLGLDCLLRMD